MTFDSREASVNSGSPVELYEFIRGAISSFPYLEYYDALATVRGAEARKRRAVAFDIDPLGKKRVVDWLP